MEVCQWSFNIVQYKGRSEWVNQQTTKDYIDNQQMARNVLSKIKEQPRSQGFSQIQREKPWEQG